MTRHRERFDDDEDAQATPKRKLKGKPDAASSTKGEGEHTGGRIKTGWKGGPGNPLAGQVQRYRMAYFVAVGPDAYRRAERMTFEQLFGVNGTGLDREGNKIHAEAKDRMTWLKQRADRSMGKVPETYNLNMGEGDGTQPDAGTAEYD